MPHFNVFADAIPQTEYHDAPAEVRVIHRSPDNHHITFYGALPTGVRFTEHPANVEETFYIIEGSIRCSLKGGETIEWKAGDLVYWPYDEELELEYSPGLRCICFFWSDEPLPDFTGGIE
jgi:quercetin dioxygenase-like cupin family protein